MPNTCVTAVYDRSYEAYVIYSFLYYLIALLGDEDYLVTILKRKPAARGEHPMPVGCFLKPWSMGQPFLTKW